MNTEKPVRAVQQYLFPEMNEEIEQAHTCLSSEPVAPKAFESFITDVRAAVARAPEGSLVVVGCSSAASHDEIAGKLLPRRPTETSPGTDPAMMTFPMPPFVTSSRNQLETLFDRYFDGMRSLNLRHNHRPLFLSPLARAPRSRTESVVETLVSHGVSLVCVSSAENVASASKRISDIDRILQQLRDIAQRSKTTHILIGEMSELWTAVKHSRLISQLQVVMQPLNNPEVKSEHKNFVAMLKAYQTAIKKCADLDLASHYEPIMARVAGDHQRFATWLREALCEAGRQGASKLEWKHLKATVPSLAQVNASKRALNAYLEYCQSKSFDFPQPGEKTAPLAAEKRKLKLRPFEPTPRRDMVENVA